MHTQQLTPPSPVCCVRALPAAAELLSELLCRRPQARAALQAALSHKTDAFTAAGSGRSHAPSCAVSAAAGLLAASLHRANVSCEQQRAVATSECLNDVTWAAPVLMRVLQPLSSELARCDSISGVGQILAAVTSPATVAAALAAAYAAVQGLLSQVYFKLWAVGSGMRDSDDIGWEQLLVASTTITQALAAWMGSGGGSSWGRARDSDGGGRSHGSSSNGGSSSSDGSSGSSGDSSGASWGPAHEAWRFALHEYKVCGAALNVSDVF